MNKRLLLTGFAKLSLLVIWGTLLSIALYGGFHYYCVHGTIISRLPILTIFISFLLSLLFLLTTNTLILRKSNNLRLFTNLFSLKSHYINYIYLLLITFVLFRFPAIGIIKAANAWLNSSPAIEISGPITRIASDLFTVLINMRVPQGKVSFYVVSVHNNIDGKIYAIDIPKDMFERKSLKLRSVWNDEIYRGAFGITYRTNWTKADPRIKGVGDK